VRFTLTFVAGVVSLIATAPWFAFSIHSVGALLPRSGVAIQSWSGHDMDPSLSFGSNLTALARAKVGGMIEPLNDIANVLGVWPFTPADDSTLRYVGVLVFLASLLALVVTLVRARRADTLRPFHWIPLYALAHTAYYGVFAGLGIRYLYPVFILMSFYLAVGLQWLIARALDPARAASNVARVAFAMLCCTFVAGAAAFQHGYGVGRFLSLQLGFYDGLAPWIKSHTEPNAVIGGFNSGIVSYYSGRRVVNLDGVMNDAAIAAIQTRTLGKYIDSQGIDYLADIDGELARFMDGFSGDPNWRAKWDKVYSDTIPTLGGTRQTRFVVLRNVSASAPK